MREADYWVAQCLEHDIAAQGKTLPEVEDAFRKTVVGQIVLDLRKGREPLDSYPVTYFERDLDGRVLECVVIFPADALERVQLTNLRYIISRLELDPTVFGLDPRSFD